MDYEDNTAFFGTEAEPDYIQLYKTLLISITI